MELRPWLSGTRVLCAVVLSLVGGLSGCSGNTACDCGPTVANPLDSEENAIVQQLNITRAGAGLNAVTVCFSLNVSAAAHADDMRDNDYLNDVSPTGTTVRTRGCAAGYSAACNGSTIPMAELVAEGNGTGDTTYAQWSQDATAEPILVGASYVVVGVGRSQGLQNEYWTLDLASKSDPSCE